MDIHDAARSGDVGIVTRLLDGDPTLIEALDEHDWYPIHAAAEYGNTDVVRLLIERGADVNIRTEEGMDYTALDRAAGNGSGELVEYLLSVGARIDIRDDDLYLPIHTAAYFGRPQVMRILLQNGADPNDRIDGRTPMTFAKSKLNDPHPRQPYNECSPAGTDDDYKEVIDILNRHGGVA